MEKITDIRTATVNGKSVKLFKLWRLVGSAWVFSGQHAAPARTANKNLMQFAP
jgi:hypothetical protein